MVNVKFSTYDWTYAGKSGVASDLMGIQVVDLVSYGGDGSNFDAVDGGYTVATQQEEGEDVPF